MPIPESILFIRLSAIGDVIHTIPCLRAVRSAFPKARIGWLVEELSAPYLQGHSDLDALYVIPKKHWRKHPLQTWLNGEKPRFYRNLRAEKWDVAIDFQGLTKSGWPAWLSGAKTRIGYGDKDGRELNKLFTNQRVVPPTSAKHVIQRNLSLLKPLGIESPSVEWTFPDWSAERARLEPFFQDIKADRFIALYPGAGWETKRWPVEHFARLAQLLAEPDSASSGIPQVLVWGIESEKTLCKEIVNQAGLDPRCLRMAPPTDLRELGALLEKSAVAVGGDTGPIHLAAALNCGVVGIYGGSDAVRNGAWGKQHGVMVSETSSCTIPWCRRCNHEPFLECLTTISPEKVAAAVHNVLDSSR